MFLNFYIPNAILLDLGFIQIHWYGLLITLALIIGFFVFYKLAKQSGIKKDQIFDLCFWLVICGVIGGRLYHVLSEIGYYYQHPLEILYIWNGGVGIFGSILSGIVVIYYFSKRKNILNKNQSQFLISNFQFLIILDLLSPALALAQAIGRWGNYFNQELYGLPSKLPWAIPISLQNRAAGYENFTHFHPTFLYESLFCLVLFFSLSRVSRAIAKRVEGSRGSQPGYIFLFYLISYSAWRFLIEFLRIDYQPVLLNLRLGQWVSLILIAASIIFYVFLRKNKLKTL